MAAYFANLISLEFRAWGHWSLIKWVTVLSGINTTTNHLKFMSNRIMVYF